MLVVSALAGACLALELVEVLQSVASERAGARGF